ncbi:MAG: hypothetical protein KDK70_07760 [Myxococcales bacterium]|nr:hypothetical protein [Myxococcales bacterium]
MPGSPTTAIRSLPWLAGLALLVLTGATCDDGDDDDDAPSCVARDASACTPLYEPTWARVFTETISPRCGTGGGACHADASAAGAEGGFVVSDMAGTHAALQSGGFVVPGDEACSPLLVRLDIDDAALRMPPGSQPLDEAERCAVAQWIAQGASP